MSLLYWKLKRVCNDHPDINCVIQCALMEICGFCGIIFSNYIMDHYNLLITPLSQIAWVIGFISMLLGAFFMLGAVVQILNYTR
jgi:hypothetical protein